MMDKATIIGLFLAFVAIGTGITLKGASISILLNPTTILIIKLIEMQVKGWSRNR